MIGIETTAKAEDTVVEEADLVQDTEVLIKEIIQISKGRNTLIRKRNKIERTCIFSSRNL